MQKSYWEEKVYIFWSLLSFMSRALSLRGWKPAGSKKDHLGVVWSDIKRSKVSQGQSDNGLNISDWIRAGCRSGETLSSLAPVHLTLTTADHSIALSVIQAENLTNESQPGEPFLIEKEAKPSLKAKANFPPMKNFADIEDMLILARPPQSELISCIGEPELGVRALEPRGLIEENRN